jgi:hypothetical protein
MMGAIGPDANTNVLVANGLDWDTVVKNSGVIAGQPRESRIESEIQRALAYRPEGPAVVQATVEPSTADLLAKVAMLERELAAKNGTNGTVNGAGPTMS